MNLAEFFAAQNRLPEGFWQTRFGSSLFITLVLMTLLGIGVWLYRRRAAIETARTRMARPLVDKAGVAVVVFRVFMIVAPLASAATVFVPQNEVGMGAMLLFITWPILVAQIVVGCLSYWPKRAQVKPGDTMMFMLTVALLFAAVDVFNAGVAGYFVP